MKSFNLTEWALGHRALVLFLILVIAVASVFSLTRLGQLEDPKFSVPSMTIMVLWPGATAQQIQDEVLNRMEKKFEQLDHFEKLSTYARQGYGGMTLSVVGGTSKADQREAWYQARKKFSDIRSELPEGVIGPIFNDEYGDVYGLLYAVKGNGVGHAELSDAAEDIKRRLLKVPMVKKVDVIGKQAKRVYVEFSHARLAALGITPAAIAESLRNQNSVLASGSIDTRSDRVLVRVTGQFASEEDIRNVPIVAGGRTIKLGDFTTVTRGFEDPPTYTVRHNGQQVLMLGIVMTDDGNIVELGKALEHAVAKVQSELPYGVELERVADQPNTVSAAIWEFERSLLEALAIVLAVSLLSLGWRTGIVVALSVPLVLGVVAVVMLGMGWNLERISLGSLIIALGLLVDDSIISVEMMVAKMETGWDRLKAAAYSYAATAMPRLSGALITVAAFMPIGFAKSSTGEYAGGIFWIVGAAVLFSWVVSGIFTPYLAVKMLPKDFGAHHQGGDPYGTPLYRKLRGAIDFAMARRWWVIGATVGALVLAVAGMKYVPQQFFPSSSRPELIVELRLKEGASFAATTEQVKRMESYLSKDEDVRFFTAYTGAGAPRFYLSLNPELPNPGFAQFVVMTKDLEARERVRSRLMNGADEEFPHAWVRVTRLELGPPVGFPVQFRVVGPDTQVVRSIAREVEAVVAASPKVRDVQLDWNDPVRTLSVHLDQDKARALGLAPADVALVTQTVMNGATLSHLREREDLVDIVARAVPSERLDLDALKDINLYTRQGTAVPLSQVARVRVPARRAGLVAAQPRHGHHRSRGRQGRRARGLGHQRNPADAEGHRGEAAFGLSHRRRRRRRGERQGQPLARSRRADHDRHDPADPHAPVAELLAHGDGVPDRAAGPDRRRGRAPRVQGAPRLRRHPRGHRVERHDHAQRADPGRPGADRDGCGPRSVERRARSGGAADPSGRVDGAGNRARHVSAHAQRVLGADGHRDHGRPHRRHGADDLLRAGPLHRVVQDRAHHCARCGYSCIAPSNR